MSALRQKHLAIVGTMDPAAAFRDAASELAELALEASGSLEELLERRPLPEAALLCTPPWRRRSEIELLLGAGLDVLALAPLAPGREDAIAVSELAERSGRTLKTAAPLHAFAAVGAAETLIAEGAIGRLESIEVVLSKKMTPPAAAGPEHGGIWLCWGPDALDLTQALAGPVDRLRMIKAKRWQGGAVDDEVLIDVEHASGVRSRLRLSWNAEIPAPLARCQGESGEIVIGWAQSVLETREKRRVFAAGYDRREVCASLLAEFLRLREQSEPPEDHGEQTVSWIEAGYRSLISGRPEIA